MDIWSALTNLWNSIPSDIKTFLFYPLAVGIVTYYLTRDSERAKAKKVMEAAPSKYAAELDALIQNGVTQGRTEAITNARAIVKVRNDLRSSLISISSQLNSEIDILAAQIRELEGNAQVPFIQPQRARRGLAPEDAVYTTIQVLAKEWPAKKTQIEVEMRKLLTELGCDPRSLD